MDLGISGKRAVITGGSKGIGRAIALSLAAEGADIALCARGEEALERTRADVERAGARCFARACDVGDEAAYGAFLDAARDALGLGDQRLCFCDCVGVGSDSGPGLWIQSGHPVGGRCLCGRVFGVPCWHVAHKRLALSGQGDETHCPKVGRDQFSILFFKKP